MQVIIKIFIVNILVIGIYFILIQYMNYWFINNEFNRYILIPGLLFLSIGFYNIRKNSDQKSFYIKDNQVFFTSSKKEKSIKASEVDLLELLTDLDWLFGFKKVIIHHHKKRYSVMLKKKKAEKLILWLQDHLQDDPLIDNLKEFFQN